MENNRLKKELLQYEEQRIDNERLQSELKRQKITDEHFKASYQSKLQENQNYLKKQIGDYRKQLMLEDYLTKEEAKNNHLTAQKTDFQKPTNDMVGGLPGFVRPLDRLKQLEMIKNTNRYNDLIQKENNLSKIPRKKTLKFHQTKPKRQHITYEAKKFNNDYQFMKNKHEQRPFNIISNTILRF